MEPQLRRPVPHDHRRDFRTGARRRGTGSAPRSTAAPARGGPADEGARCREPIARTVVAGAPVNPILLRPNGLPLVRFGADHRSGEPTTNQAGRAQTLRTTKRSPACKRQPPQVPYGPSFRRRSRGHGIGHDDEADYVRNLDPGRYSERTHMQLLHGNPAPGEVTVLDQDCLDTAML
jgi:hypothetical protein